jgi:predicted dehydrogenase
MVGGGRGAFIGEAHRIAARLDDRYELVAGALSSDPQRAIESGRDLRLDPMRCYADWRGMAQAEATRKDGIEVVSVVTPNASHHAICKTFLEAGIDVICDKPLTTTFAEAQDLLAMVRRTGRLLGVTYTYTGYLMVREARALIESGALGAVRVVQVEFALGWLSGPSEGDSKQAAWRTDPAQAGASFIVGDLGTHCFHLSEFVTGRRTAALAERPADHGAGSPARGQGAYPPALRQWCTRRHVGFCGCGRRAGRAAAPRLMAKKAISHGSRATPTSSPLPFKARRRARWSVAGADCHPPPSARHVAGGRGRALLESGSEQAKIRVPRQVPL